MGRSLSAEDSRRLVMIVAGEGRPGARIAKARRAPAKRQLLNVTRDRADSASVDRHLWLGDHGQPLIDVAAALTSSPLDTAPTGFCDVTPPGAHPRLAGRGVGIAPSRNGV